MLECLTCQQNKVEQTFPASLLQPLPIPNQKWESILMDFIIGFSKVQGKDCIFVVVDRLTKYAYFYAISSEYRAPQVADLFLERCLDYMGCL